jgi:hypothetical protein
VSGKYWGIDLQGFLILGFDSADTSNEPALHAPAELEEQESPTTLERVRAAALQQLKETGLLTPAEYAGVEGTASLQDILRSVDEINLRDITTRPQAKKITGVLKSLFQRLGKFESAVDMLAGSMPQVCGFNLVGIIWGSLKLFIAVSPRSFFRG